MPQEIYAVTDDKSLYPILDVGGDERGALALGRLAPKIVEEDYDMFYVINKYRPLTNDIEGAIEVFNEIESACKIKFTAIINNSNLGEETTKEDVLSSINFANELAKAVNLPLLFTTVNVKIYEQLKNENINLYPLRLQKKL